MRGEARRDARREQLFLVRWHLVHLPAARFFPTHATESFAEDFASSLAVGYRTPNVVLKAEIMSFTF